VYQWLPATSVSVYNVLDGQTTYLGFSSGCTDYGHSVGYC